jgi:hypothetical protein
MAQDRDQWRAALNIAIYHMLGQIHEQFNDFRLGSLSDIDIRYSLFQGGPSAVSLAEDWRDIAMILTD